MNTKPMTPAPAAPETTPPVRKTPQSKNWKRFTIPALLAILVAIPLTIFMTSQQQDIRQRAAGETATASATLSSNLVCTAGSIDTFLVIDKSESMENKIKNKAKLTWAKEAADTFMKLVLAEKTNTVGIASFAKNGGVNADFSNDFAKLSKVVDDMKNESNKTGTCLECALIEVNEKITARNAKSKNNKYVLILSDGEVHQHLTKDGTTEGSPQPADVKIARERSEQQMDKGIKAGTKFYLIGIEKPNEEGLKWLQSLEKKWPGKVTYVYGGEGDQLEKIYKEIAVTMGKLSISGTVFEDVNEDGKFTVPPDASMSGVLVSLRLASAATGSAALATATSDANGKYTFTSLCGQKYRITQTPKDSYTQTVPLNPDYYEVDTSTATTDIKDKNFGNVKGEIKFTYSFALHGIGIAGDNVLLRPSPCVRGTSASNSAATTNPCYSNQNPLHPTRPILIEIMNDNNVAIASMSGDIKYNKDKGIFEGQNKIKSGVKKGNYTFRATTPMFLRKKIIFSEVVKPGETYELPLTDLISSNVNNNDVSFNELTISDYVAIVACYTYVTQATPTCDQAGSDAVDTDDNGKVNEFDMNLFVRELSARFGD